MENNEMVGARRAIVNRVGADVVGGARVASSGRAAAEQRPRSTEGNNTS